jgi:hypothetical protein
MLLFTDPSSINTELLGGTLDCPRSGCAGTLRPWGWARPRQIRVSPQRHISVRPRRGRCGACSRTQVLASWITYPRRVDTVETVGAALTAAATGLGHRRVAERLGLPATTVRDWIRRARINAEDVRVIATIRVHALDPLAHPLAATGTALGDMIDAVGRMLAAWTVRIGPPASSWKLAAAITGGRLLAAPSHRRNAT